MATRPGRGEAADYFFTYIDQVPDGDIVGILERQLPDTLSLLRDIGEEQSLQRYAPDKWTIREMMAHVTDTERVFTFRALWFARGLQAPLPSFDQNLAAAASRADDRPWRGHVDEFDAVRAATLALFQNLAPEAWARTGQSGDRTVSVRALAYITAGHVTHHVRILRERYLGG